MDPALFSLYRYTPAFVTESPLRRATRGMLRGMRSTRDAWRSIVKTPGLAIAAALCIGLGAAATMAVATLVDSVLVRPVPFPQADRLIRVWLEEPGVDPHVSLSIPESRELRALPAFAPALATARVRTTVVAGDRAERMRGEGVDAGYFDVLGLRPAMGRLLEPADHQPDAPAVVVLGHAFWLRAYGGSAAAIGSLLKTGRATYTIVGIAPRGFAGTVEDDQVEFWTPLEKYEPSQMLTDRDARQTWMVARLAADARLPDAVAQLAALEKAWVARDPERYRHLRLHAEPFGESWRRGFRAGTLLLVGAAGALLAIAALNVGCLLLARVLDRRRELAIRAALGAGRSRLARQLIVESLIVSAAGAVLGILAGPAVLEAVLAMSPVALPSYVSVSPDLRVTLAALTALVMAALVAGTVPAFVGSTSHASAAIGSRGTASAPGEKRWVTVLIASETALTLVLLVCGTLMLRSYDRLASLDLGFRREGIARLAVTLSAADGGPLNARAAVYDRLRRAVAAVPGVTSVGFVTPTLPPWDADRTRVRFDDLDPRSAELGVPAGLHVVDEGLLPTLGIPMVAGRNFAAREAAAVAIVSRGLADRMGGAEAAVGRSITLPEDPAMMSRLAGRFTIVGVAENVAWDGLVEQDTRRMIHYTSAADPRAGRWDVYVPLSRLPQSIISIAAATDGSATALVEPIRRAVAGVTPTSAVHWTGVMDDEVALEYAPAKFYGVLIALFSASAMLLTGAGLLALLWHASVRRTAEMGLRFALGATRTGVALLIVRAGMAPIVTGVLAGLVGALWAADAIKALLYDVPPFDPLAFAAAFALLAGVAALAAWLPARRAARVDPLVALRSE